MYEKYAKFGISYKILFCTEKLKRLDYIWLTNNLIISDMF
jgi:hypothetical protein